MEETIKSWWLECFKSVRFSLTETPLLLLLTSQWALMSKLFHWFLDWSLLHWPKNAILKFLDWTKNGWRCTDFRLDFLIDIVKKFVISLTSARSYSKASRCVKGFFFTCDGRRGWLPRPPMLLLRELDKTDFWNIFYLFWENLLHSFYRHPIRKYSVGEKDSKHLFTSISLRRWENIF